MESPAKISRAGKRIYEIAQDTSLKDLGVTKKFIAKSNFIEFNKPKKPNNIDKLLKDIRW
jgi:hypothetical protein